MDLFNIPELFVFNNFNIFFIIIGAILTFSTSMAAFDYLKENKFWYYILNIFYILGFVMVIATKSWFAFIIGWEIVTITTTFMIVWSSQKIARQYFIIQFTGSSILLYVILVAVSHGYKTIGVINEPWLLVLFVIGVGMKSGIFGLHFWLPPVHSNAPAPVSAVLSGWVVKLGFITILKLITSPSYFLVIIGLLMIFYGGLKALFQSDLKVLLAYSTISQLGFIALALGNGSKYAMAGAIFHIVAHGFAKTNLFINSGFLEKEYNSRSIYKMSSLWKRNKTSAFAITISLFSLMGVFFLTGYHSKHLIKNAFKGIKLIEYLIHAASITTIMYSLRLMWWLWIRNLFSNDEKSEGKKNFSPGIYGYSVIIFLSFVLIYTGINPQFLATKILDFEIHFHFLDGLIDYILYFIFAIIILWKFDFIKSEEKRAPSLDNVFNNLTKSLYKISGKVFEFDTGVFFESYLYEAIYNFSRSIYNLIYTDFQLQLLWIPTLFMILYAWIILIA